MDHPLAIRSSVSFDETLVYEHIGLHEGSTLLAFLRGLLDRHGYDRKLRIQVRSFEAMCRMAEAGVGIGVVPESAAIRHVQTMQIALIKIDEPWAVLKHYVLVRELDALPRAAQALVAELVARQIGGMSAGKQEAG